MDRFNRSQKKRRFDDDDDYQAPTTPAPIAAHYLQTLNPLGRPPRDEEEKRVVFLQLIRLKENRRTDLECAQALGVSERTIRNYKTDPLYLEIEQDLQSESRVRGRMLISEVSDSAIEKLYGLMGTAKSEFVQYKSAEYLLKLAGYEQPPEEMQRDNQNEVIDFLSKIAKRTNPGGKTTINVQVNNSGPAEPTPRGPIVDAVPQEYLRPLLPGGRLPPEEND